MSIYFSEKYKNLTPYVPGEQPKERKYIKLNTNESPFPPSPLALTLARQKAGDINLYSDPECINLVSAACEVLGIEKENIIFTNGSDEALNFAFMAFCDEKKKAVFPNITYGFYKVFAELHGIDYKEIPLGSDLSLNVDDYLGINETIFIANPNAPTGLCLPLSDIEKIVASNPESVVVVDEAYVDFGGESAIKLTKKYKNLLVCRTFSKSRSLAGARLGFAVGDKELINDLNTIKYSTNPYNVNSMTMLAGVGALLDEKYFKDNCEKIIKTREKTKKSLENLGFDFTDSKANFLFAKSDKISGKALYEKLRENGILVRRFDKEIIKDYNRITVGSDEEMQILIETIQKILGEIK